MKRKEFFAIVAGCFIGKKGIKSIPTKTGCFQEVDAIALFCGGKRISHVNLVSPRTMQNGDTLHIDYTLNFK